MARRILNLNDISGRALLVILTLLVPLPGLLLLVEWLLRGWAPFAPALGRLAKLIFGAGALLLAGFFLLVALELVQDELLYRQTLRERGQRFSGECPYCGNRQIHAFERFCTVCGNENGDSRRGVETETRAKLAARAVKKLAK